MMDEKALDAAMNHWESEGYLHFDRQRLQECIQTYLDHRNKHTEIPTRTIYHKDGCGFGDCGCPTQNRLGKDVCPNHPFQQNAECKTCYVLSTKTP